MATTVFTHLRVFIVLHRTQAAQAAAVTLRVTPPAVQTLPSPTPLRKMKGWPLRRNCVWNFDCLRAEGFPEGRFALDLLEIYKFKEQLPDQESLDIIHGKLQIGMGEIGSLLQGLWRRR